MARLSESSRGSISGALATLSQEHRNTHRDRPDSVRANRYLFTLLSLPSSGDKRVVEDHCPIFNAWLIVSEQARSMEAQAFAVSTVAFTVDCGTTEPFKCHVKTMSEALFRRNFSLDG